MSAFKPTLRQRLHRATFARYIVYPYPNGGTGCTFATKRRAIQCAKDITNSTRYAYAAIRTNGTGDYAYRPQKHPAPTFSGGDRLEETRAR